MQKKDSMSHIPDDRGEGFIELALVLILVAIVLIVILALLGPELTEWLTRFRQS
jgi:Flp pilus assembly pilin Flp